MNARLRATVLAALLLGLPAMGLLLQPAPVDAAGQLTTYMTGLNVPIALAFSPDGRIFYAERNTGNIRIIDGGTLLATPFYTLPNTATAGERGLLGLALDSGFPAVPWVYAYQTYNDLANGTVYNRIVRIQASGNAGVSDTVILRMPPLSGATNHNGGVIAFGPDGMLYAVVGENANIPLAQDLTSPMGKVLRMNPDGTPPPDNPFYGSLTIDNLIYTYGHRNMFGLAFHPSTGRAYVTENGPGCNDEVNLLEAGRNYGWGPTQTCTTPPPPPNNTNRDGPSPVLPIWWWGGTICPTNAAIYGGPFFPAWRGDLFMGDCNFRRFHRLHLVPPAYATVASDEILLTAPNIILDVEVGPDGAIWITTPTTIYRYVDVSQGPTASFTAAPNPVDPGIPVSFDASASSDPDGFIVSYAWDFGDSTTGTGVTASHAYATPGTYRAVLTVVDNESYAASIGTDVVVRSPPAPEPPVASFTATPNPVDPGAPVGFDASASFDPDGTIVSYDWDFGDSTTGMGVTTTHAYPAPGTYRVLLTVVDNESYAANTTTDVVVRSPPVPQPPAASFTATPNPVDSGVPVGFDASASSDPDGFIVSYAWDFGDSTTGTGVTTTHAYALPGSYRVLLTVVDNESYTGNTTRDVVVRSPPTPQPPVASFIATPSRVNPGVAVAFDASASSDPDGFIVWYAWDFGDGTNATSILPSTTHPYPAPGLYTTTLTVYDNASYSGNTTRTVRVNAAPSAAFTVTPATAYIGVLVTFGATGSSDPDGDPLTFAWDFGDSGGAAGATVTHAYAAKGRFTVILTASDDLGATGQSSRAVDIGNRAPVITATDPAGGTLTLAPDQARTFSVTATDPDGDVLAYEWRVNGVVVGGNASSIAFNESAVGTYSVSVTVTDGLLDDSASWGVAVTVGTGPPSNPNELPVSTWWAAGLILLAVLAAAILFVVWRRRRKEPSPPPPPAP